MIKSLLRRGAGNIKKIFKRELLIVEDVIDLESLTKEERHGFLEKIHELYESKELRLLLDNVTAQQNRATMSTAETEQQLWAGRCSLVGVWQIKEELKRLNSLWEAGRVTEEPFNKHSVI